MNQINWQINLNQWYQTPLGARVLSVLKGPLISAIGQSRNDYLLLVTGQQAYAHLCQKEGVKFVHLSAHLDNCTPAVQGEAQKLAIKESTMKMAVVIHEFSRTNIQVVLTELDRALTEDGQLIIVGFNPYSLWGLIRGFKKQSQKAPWSSPFVSISRIKNSLKQLDYEIMNIRTYVHILPKTKERYGFIYKFINVFANIARPYPGALYLISAKKKTIPLMPIKTIFKFKNLVFGKSMAEPAARSKLDTNSNKSKDVTYINYTKE